MPLMQLLVRHSGVETPRPFWLRRFHSGGGIQLHASGVAATQGAKEKWKLDAGKATVKADMASSSLLSTGW